MIDQVLLARLRPALERRRRQRMLLGFVIGWLVAALVVAFILPAAGELAAASDAGYSATRWLLLPGGLLLGYAGGLIGRAIKPDIRKVARQLEAQYPDLDGRLTTALQQEPEDTGGFNFLQEHLFTETIHHSTQQDWRSVVPDSSIRWARAAQCCAVLSFLVLWFLLPRPASVFSQKSKIANGGNDSVQITPGDTELEKGTSLVLLARFENTLPGSADLVIGDSVESERRIPLTRSLNDPVFGGTVPDVKEPFTYRVAWDGGGTREFKVRVFEYPKLERSDVTLTYPEYAKLPPKRIEDTRHTSAVEGTRIDLDLALNKPVASAVLEPRKAKDQKDDAAAPPPLKLETFPDKAMATLRGFVPAQSSRYELVLTDADGRHSRQAVPFSFDVVPNRVPELKLASPKGDQKPSALQEMMFDGTVWDDFGVVACGLELGTPDGKTVTLDFGRDVPGKEKRTFQHLLRFEDLKAAPDQLFAWHTWVDDYGPDGKVRRTRGDLFFAEVRPFEEIFRQGAGMDGSEQQQQQQQQQGQGNQTTKLADLQKQIINATWKLQRAPASPKLPDDLKIVRDSQEDAQKQAQEMATGAGNRPQLAASWQAVLQHMQQAVERLEKAATAPAELVTAVAPEQAAYQALLKLRAREKEVSRASRSQQSGQQSGGQGEQQEQRQLDQLELTKKENRYETQREAQAQQSAERREQMQILNRLKELAARQQDVNEKLKELQTALNEAKTEAEKEEARRQLKRLEDEQRQMLADADELRQRMEQQQNQSQASEQRQQLDQARENMQQAAEAAAEGQPGQALASGTRAEQQMQQMREAMRKQSAGAFEQELREMRAEARELSRKQEEIARQMKSDPSDPSDPSDKSDAAKKAPSLGGAADEEQLTKALDEQQQRTGDFVQRATELSEQAEPSEPLLSRKIYETARQFAQDDSGAVKQAQQEMIRDGRLSNRLFEEMRELQEAERSGKALRLTSRLKDLNLTRQAGRTSERASEDMKRLREGVEQAADSVLGDDTQALRLAESQLEAAAEAMRREAEQQDGQPREGDRNQQANTGGQREGQQQGSQPPDGQQPQEGNGRQQGGGQQRADQQQTAQNQPREGQQSQDGQQGGGRQPGSGQSGGQPRDGQQPNEARSQESSEQIAQNQPQEERQSGQGGGQQDGQQGQRNGQSGNGQNSQAGPDEEGSRTADRRGRANRLPNGSNGGGGGGGPNSGLDMNRIGGGGRRTAPDPLTGDGFTDWSDRLREAEEMIDETDLRNDIAAARERARLMRLEMKRDQKKPDWKAVQLEIVKPLVEVRNRVREELARRDSDKALVPVDRDPVPAQFSENVRRYYEQLGKDQ